MYITLLHYSTTGMQHMDRKWSGPWPQWPPESSSTSCFIVSQNECWEINVDVVQWECCHHGEVGCSQCMGRGVKPINMIIQINLVLAWFIRVICGSVVMVVVLLMFTSQTSMSCWVRSQPAAVFVQGALFLLTVKFSSILNMASQDICCIEWNQQYTIN